MSVTTPLFADHRPDGGKAVEPAGNVPKINDTIYRQAPSGNLPPISAAVPGPPAAGRIAPDKQLVLIELGLNRTDEGFRDADLRLAVQLRKNFRQRFAGSEVRVDALIDRGQLETAALAKEGFRRVLVIFLGATPPDRWSVRSKSGWLNDKTVGEALNRLAVRLHLPVKSPTAPLDILQGPAVHTVLLTDLAGDVDCALFPGPVFGLASRRGPFPQEFVEEWLQEVERNSATLLPPVAPQWFDVFRYRDRGRVGVEREAWLCPADAPGGYRGAKLRSN